MERQDYAGKQFTMRYTTSGYYDIRRTADGFSFEYKKFDEIRNKSFTDAYYEEWLDDPVEYGAFENGKLLGFIEGFHEKWNNRYRISNICVFEEEDRHKGIGTALMSKALELAEECGARMAVLETQSCNEKAIAFYRKCGFDVIGFDLYSYSNTDIEQHEIRVEMGKKLK